MNRSLAQSRSSTSSGGRTIAHSRTSSSSSASSSRPTSQSSTPSRQASTASANKRKTSTQAPLSTRKRARSDNTKTNTTASVDRSPSLPVLPERDETERRSISNLDVEESVYEEDMHLEDGSLQGNGLNVPGTNYGNVKVKKSGPFITIGRFIIRSVVAFQDLYRIFNEGVIRINANWPADPDEEFDDTELEAFSIPEEPEQNGFNHDLDAPERDRLYGWFCKIYRAFPNETMKIIAAESSEYTELVGELITGAGYARSTDLHAVRDLLPSWFPNIQTVAKCSRGFFNHHTAMLLRPANIEVNDSEMMKRFQEDESLSFPPTAELPRFFYSGNPEMVVDVERPMSTILRGSHHFASYCRIYQSDKAAIKIFTLKGEGKLDTLSDNADDQALNKRSLGTNVSVGKQCGINGPTAHAIAYAGCLLRAALSSTEKLVESDDPLGTYSYSTLYREIVDVIAPSSSASTNQGVDDIMAWWTKHAYPTKRTVQHAPPPRLSARERMNREAIQAPPLHPTTDAAEAGQPSVSPALPVSGAQEVPYSAQREEAGRVGGTEREVEGQSGAWEWGQSSGNEVDGEDRGAGGGDDGKGDGNGEAPKCLSGAFETPSFCFGILREPLTRFARFALSAPARAEKSLSNFPMYAEALSTDIDITHIGGKASALFGLAQAHRFQNEYSDAVDLYSKSLQIDTDIGNKNGQASALFGLAEVHRHRQEYSKAATFYSKSLQIYTDIGSKDGQASALFGLAEVHRHRNKYSEAINLHSECLQISTDIGNKHRQVATLFGLAEVHRLRNEYSKALDFYSRCLKISTDIGDRNGQASALSGLAVVHRFRQEHSEAVACYSESLQIHTDVGNKHGQATTLFGLAEVHRFRNEYSEAVDLYSKSLQINTDISNKHGQALALFGLAEMHRFRNEYSEAVNFYSQCLQVNTNIGNRNGQASALLGLAGVHRFRHEYSEAVPFYSESLQISTDVGNKLGQATALFGLAEVHRLRNEGSEAVNFYSQCLQINTDIGNKDGQALALSGLAGVHQLRNNNSEALTLYSESLQIYTSIGNRQGQASALFGLAEVHLFRKEYSQAIASSAEALTIYTDIGDQSRRALTLFFIADVHNDHHDYNSAIHHYQQAAELFRKIGNTCDEAVALERAANVRRSMEQSGAT
ncbi:hypothetical protein FRC01_013536 [Tulasnella sp. 417]|nr:hypothetical protein FRC01_013536 [Tulasnella sp. 417]